MASLHKTGQLLSSATRTWLFAVALVLAAQTAGIVHDLDPQNAPPDHVCELCHLGAHLDHADVGRSPGIEFRAQADEPLPVASVLAQPVRAELPPVRGPPTVS